MRMTAELATLAEAEEDMRDEDEEDDREDDVGSNEDEDRGSSEISAFDVAHFRYIDDDDAGEREEDEGREGGWKRGSGRSWCPGEEDCCNSSSYRYVVVSGTPLKILEHLLSDLRLDDQRGAPECRESGECVHTSVSAH